MRCEIKLAEQLGQLLNQLRVVLRVHSDMIACVVADPTVFNVDLKKRKKRLWEGQWI